MAETTIEAVIRNELTVKYGEDEFVFKVPSIQDRIGIAARGAKLRKDSDPDGTGFALGYDPTTVMFTDSIATFMVLLKSTSAKWVYSPNEVGKLIMDLDKWQDNVPVVEVVEQFNKELASFRAGQA